ncbi:HDOD domain-containing protein [Massilia sp. YIM B02763]|uniref:HDOD domain-containing protein n=1 Tax=Massilia sp. YIM B02763 TaxID=3050130 RepID=UPI0025B6CB9D|nr:HDOD domain-containing protein [Massilia sp. YIM B02763]MDN4054331.1 HDOD domain-containing protein [Massilia sp. YIM B02763]
MKNWIARLFGTTAVAARPAGAAGRAPGVAGPAGAAPDAGAPLSLDAAFWRWLTDPIAGESPDAAQRRLLDELERLGEHPGDAAELVPRMPEVIPRLLRSLRDDAVSGAELARQVGRDPVMVAETIREANSACYRPAKPVRTVDAAVMVLGQNGLRMLLARVAFRPVIGLAAGSCARQAAPRLWRHAEHCARAGALLAPGLGADPFEAYLAGLMHDMGLVVAFRLADRILEGPFVPQDEAFATAVLDGARALSARIALHWELPPPVAAAIFRAGRSATQPLGEALGEADRVARLRLLLDAGLLVPGDPTLAGLGAAASRVLERLDAEEA